MDLPIHDGGSIITKAFEKREEEKAWQMWVAIYPHMNKESFVLFSDFYKQQTQTISTRPTEEILAEVEEIRKNFERR